MSEIRNIRSIEVSDKPLVSFIVTTYNLPTNLLEGCFDSILSLSLRQDEYEIILVDDGSQPSPIEHLEAYRDKILYVRQCNQGLSVARNTGLRIASGQYVQFVDGDDTLIPVAYEHCLDIVRYHNPDIVMFESSHTQDVATSYAINGPETGCTFMRNNNIHASAWGYVFRKKILGGLRFTPGIVHEDEDFTPQLFLRAERFFTTDAHAYFYRQRAGSITTSRTQEAIQKRLQDTEWVICHLQSLVDTLPEEAKAAMRRRIAQLTMDYLYNIMHENCGQEMLEAAIERLRQKGLFPLPNMNYTKKYSLFRMAINNKTARKAMSKIVKG